MKKTLVLVSVLLAASGFAQEQASIKENTIESVSLVGAKKYAEKKSDQVARMPLNNLENPQVYTVVPKELLLEQVSVDFRGALLSSPVLQM